MDYAPTVDKDDSNHTVDEYNSGPIHQASMEDGSGDGMGVDATSNSDSRDNRVKNLSLITNNHFVV